MQACVVSLEEVRATVDEAFECRFTRPVGARPPTLTGISSPGTTTSSRSRGRSWTWARSSRSNWRWRSTPIRVPPDADALVARELGPNIALGEDEPEGALAVAMMDKGQGAARAAPPSRGRGSWQYQRRKYRSRGATCAARTIACATVNLVECANCGEFKLPHHICQACGHYNGREVIAAGRGQRGRLSGPSPVTADHRPRRHGRRSRAAGGDRGRRHGARALSRAALPAVRRPRRGCAGCSTARPRAGRARHDRAHARPVEPDAKPSQVLRQGRNTSMRLAIDAVKDGRAERRGLGRQHRRADGAGQVRAQDPARHRAAGDRLADADPAQRGGVPRPRRQHRMRRRQPGPVRGHGRGLRPRRARRRQADRRPAQHRHRGRQGPRHDPRGGGGAARERRCRSSSAASSRAPT